jgi:hypothetical protein
MVGERESGLGAGEEVCEYIARTPIYLELGDSTFRRSRELVREGEKCSFSILKCVLLMDGGTVLYCMYKDWSPLYHGCAALRAVRWDI